MDEQSVVSMQRVKIVGIQLVEQGGKEFVTLSCTDAPAPAADARATRSRGGRMIAGESTPMHGSGAGYTRTVPAPSDDDAAYRPGEIMTIVLLRGDHTAAGEEEEDA